MFRVKGDGKENQQYHELLIRKVAKCDVGAGIILAAVYFEWCVRRSIVALGRSEVAYLNELLARKDVDTDALIEIWRADVQNESIPSLPNVFDLEKGKPRFGNLVLTWKDVGKARKMRNRLVHGNRCTPLSQTGVKYVELLIAAADKLIRISSDRDRSIFRVIRGNANRKGVRTDFGKLFARAHGQIQAEDVA